MSGVNWCGGIIENWQSKKWAQIWAKTASSPTPTHRLSYTSRSRLRAINRLPLPPWSKGSTMVWVFRPCSGSQAQAKPLRWPMWLRKRDDPRWCSHRIKPWQRSCTASFVSFSRTMRSSISSPTTIIISLKRMCRSVIYSSKKTRRLMSISSKCVCLRPKACSSGAMWLSWGRSRVFTG